MDQFTEMQVFVRAIEQGAFAKAAKDIGITPSAVSKIVTRLERRLGIRLVNRTTRRIALTPEGEQYFVKGRHLIQEFRLLEEEVSASAEQPRGVLRINCGFAFGLRQLVPLLKNFQLQYPQVRIELSLTDHVVDLHSEGADIAIRTLASLQDSRLLARKIANTNRVICASPAYIEAFGMPRTPDDLTHHQCILFRRGGNTINRWPFKSAGGGTDYVEVTGTLISDNRECILQLALAGMGVIRMGELVVSQAIRQRRLVPLLADVHDPEEQTTWAVFHPRSQNIPRVRVFLDFLIEHFGNGPWQLAPAGDIDHAWGTISCRGRV